MLEQQFILHREPVWRDRADFIMNAELSEEDKPYNFEQLWARKIGNNRFEICCIPFFLYDVSLGDIVETSAKGERQYVMRRVVRKSGRYVFRVWLGESNYPRDALIAKLTELGALIEWSSNNLFAVDTVDKKHAQIVADYLAEHEKSNHLVYETGRTKAARPDKPQ